MLRPRNRLKDDTAYDMAFSVEASETVVAPGPAGGDYGGFGPTAESNVFPGLWWIPKMR